jgi:hypothetical protein
MKRLPHHSRETVKVSTLPAEAKAALRRIGYRRKSVYFQEVEGPVETSPLWGFWDSGCRSEFAAFLNGEHVALPVSTNPPQFGGVGQTAVLEAGTVFVEFGTFCGKAKLARVSIIT